MCRLSNQPKPGLAGKNVLPEIPPSRFLVGCSISTVLAGRCSSPLCCRNGNIVGELNQILGATIAVKYLMPYWYAQLIVCFFVPLLPNPPLRSVSSNCVESHNGFFCMHLFCCRCCLPNRLTVWVLGRFHWRSPGIALFPSEFTSP